jgi:hypothetical protein
LYRAWAAARGSTIRHALAWAFAAWAGWAVAASASAGAGGVWTLWLALSLTACAGVSVLNARRPHAFAWHFVVAGLLVVLLRPLWEGAVRGGGTAQQQQSPGGLYVAALAVGLAVAVGNHLPTRLGVPAAVVGAVCGLVLAGLKGASVAHEWAAWPALACVPWLGWLLVRKGKMESDFDRRWLTFRDRFGFGWAALTRELFNNAARNAGWPVVLRWGGLRGDARGARELATFRALVQRFETWDVPAEPTAGRL